MKKKINRTLGWHASKFSEQILHKFKFRDDDDDDDNKKLIHELRITITKSKLNAHFTKGTHIKLICYRCRLAVQYKKKRRKEMKKKNDKLQVVNIHALICSEQYNTGQY